MTSQMLRKINKKIQDDIDIVNCLKLKREPTEVKFLSREEFMALSADERNAHSLAYKEYRDLKNIGSVSSFDGVASSSVVVKKEKEKELKRLVHKPVKLIKLSDIEQTMAWFTVRRHEIEEEMKKSNQYFASVNHHYNSQLEQFKKMNSVKNDDDVDDDDDETDDLFRE